MSEEYIAQICAEVELRSPGLEYVVYVLRSQTNKNLMYCGMTSDIRRRLRQHNGHLAGGGKYTSANRPWHLAAIIPISVRGEDTAQAKSRALKVEYWTKAKNYAVEGYTQPGPAGYRRPARREIPTQDAVTRRVWLLQETTRRHGLQEPLWFDPDLQVCWK